MEKLDLDGLGTVDKALIRIDALGEHYDAIGTIVFREFEPLATRLGSAMAGGPDHSTASFVWVADD